MMDTILCAANYWKIFCISLFGYNPADTHNMQYTIKSSFLKTTVLENY